MLLRWRRLWRSLLNLRLVASFALGSLFLWATLPYDNAIRLSVRFNTQRLLKLATGPFINERWLYEEPTFPVDWAHDVAIILKTGYGTQERALAWFEALPMEINPESVLVVGDFNLELKVGGEMPMGVKVHDVVAGVLERRPCSRYKSENPPCPRVEKYRNLRAAISAGADELARNLSGSFGWELDAVKFLPALELAYRSMPRKKWFILLDDDTYLIQPSLNALLGHFDPSIPYYIGNAVGDYRQRFAHGGSSITLSRATMHKLFAGRNHRALATARRASATEVWGDRLLADALLRLGIHIEEGTGRFFNGERPWASRLRSDRFCVPVSTFHRLTAEEMKGVGRVFRKAVDSVLWVDLWDIFHGPSFATYEVTPLRREWDHVGRLDEHTVTLAGVKAALGCSRLYDAERLLVEYREYMEPLFPFVVIPGAMSSDQLRREKPMLWKAVMMQAMYMDPSRQVPLGNELLNDIVTACFLKPNKSFDLLQALEVLVACRLHVKLQSFQMTNMLFLMRSMCVSLGFSESQNAMKQQEHNSTSLEQMRTFAGVYYLVTMVFTTNKKPDAFMNTSYLEACCRVLKEKMEYPTDELAVYLIRTQQLSQSISMTLAFRSTSLPLSIIVKGFREQIDQLRRSMPQSIKDYAAIKTQLHISEILLYEVGLNEELSASLPFTERLELLWECLKATRSMLEARFEKSKDDRPRQTYLSTFDFTYAMLTCLKLSTINIPGWDIRLARKELDFDEFLDKQIQDLKDFVAKRSKAIKRTGGANTKMLLGDLDQFECMYKKLEKLRISLKAELAATIPPEGASETAQVGFADPGMDSATELGPPDMVFPSDSFPEDLIQGLDGSFWQDVCWVNEWDPGFGALMGWEASWICPERRL
ncbi:hypothetical protein VP1G_07056 [Cytospora mali]|uniref:Fringe-like glycosyltransferase domain-containing protein n=1 Tax=Cytospora mali TaxID=578113 RepID=A0A194V7C8_CYTMA|nr:hypothetical protein VP1G_07056 [Valsa mali var. pyri (nom. inval.)]